MTYIWLQLLKKNCTFEVADLQNDALQQLTMIHLESHCVELLCCLSRLWDVTSYMFESKVNKAEKRTNVPISKRYEVKIDVKVNSNLFSHSVSNSFKKKQKKQQHLFTTILLQWDFSPGKFGLHAGGKPAATVLRYPTYGACCVFECFHNPPNCDMDMGSLTHALM